MKTPHHADPAYQRLVFNWLRDRLVHHAAIGAAAGAVAQILSGAI